jgi:hypothetical protein
LVGLFTVPRTAVWSAEAGDDFEKVIDGFHGLVIGSSRGWKGGKERCVGPWGGAIRWVPGWTAASEASPQRRMGRPVHSFYSVTAGAESARRPNIFRFPRFSFHHRTFNHTAEGGEKKSCVALPGELCFSLWEHDHSSSRRFFCVRISCSFGQTRPMGE